jgi:hypothetical protein
MPLEGIPSVAVQIAVVGFVLVGFVLGYYARGWKDRADGMEELTKLGIHDKIRAWLRDTDRK